MKSEFKIALYGLIGLGLGVVFFFICLMFKSPEKSVEEGLRKTHSTSPEAPVSEDAASSDGSGLRAEGRLFHESAEPASSSETEVDGVQEVIDKIYSEEFSQSDVSPEKMKVSMDLGEYTVDEGDEIEFGLKMSAPALESLTVLMEYDSTMLEYVKDSAKAKGKAFRNGIEFYADDKKGQMVLINAGIPGAKNINGVEETEIVTFRMRSKKAGKTKLECPTNAISFVNGRGNEIDNYSINGGFITIR